MTSTHSLVSAPVGAREFRLSLEDGTEFEGLSFGAPAAVAGEVVFNTGMSGYVESLTDPSYRGQILVLTYPLVGNYGVPAPRAAGAIAGPYESARIQPQALIVQAYSSHFSHHAATRSLGDWLSAEGVPAITGIDTRQLTRRLRHHGTMRGWVHPATLSLAEAQRLARNIDMQSEVFYDVAPTEPVTYEGGSQRVLLVDCGAKDQIARSLLERGATVIRVPWHADLQRHAQSAHAILIGNGPGDPQNLGKLSEQVRGLMSSFAGPIMGVCLGHQILAIAAGGRTYKLPYGHRGVNQPVQDLITRRGYITSQNHGYAVDDESIPADWDTWFVNVNDGTNEGIRAQSRLHYSVQFHPEATPGPQDTGHLFDEFLRHAGSYGRNT
jgi:carbamoyl-phosphate synthase small subunit